MEFQRRNHRMGTSRSRAALAVLAAVVFASLAFTGCYTRTTYYDDYHHDYHHWNNHEVVVYHSYWEGHHQPYREYSTLNKDEQRDYWKWRHEHH
jgi:hypothetical protein